MSEIYLTKVERKTIFTQGLIYVLFTFIISDLTVTGPHAFSIIPWLFFLGILGVSKFYHPIMTVILSTITTFIASLFKYNGLNMQVLTSVLVCLAMTMSGLIVGLCIKDFILEHRLVKQIPVHKKILNITVMILLTVGSIVLYAVKYGNVIGYVMNRVKLDKYITAEFDTEEYILEEQQFLSGTFSRYVYIVNIQDNTFKLKVGSDVEILNYDEIKSNFEDRLNSKLKEEIKDNIFNVKLSYKYNNYNAKPVSIIAVLSLDNFEVENVDKLNAVINEIKYICDYKDEFNNTVSTVILSINGGVQTIQSNNFNNISEEYIKNCLNIEQFDIN